MRKNCDVVIIGGGYAGIAAAIYLGRFNRSCIIIDSGSGRWNTNEINENYLGFPEGITTRDLRERGLIQAKRFGALYVSDHVKNIEKNQDYFLSTSNNNCYYSKAVIMATGVKDHFPHFDQWREYVGKSLFWCITCDGHKTINKRIVILGNIDDAMCDAMQFRNFTNAITFITNCPTGEEKISTIWKDRLMKAHIPFYAEPIIAIQGKNGLFEKLQLKSGREIAFDYMFSEQESTPLSHLAAALGVTISSKGYILTTIEQRTNIPLFYAAGDVIKAFSHQIASAVHGGATAAEAANYDLYSPEQQDL